MIPTPGISVTAAHATIGLAAYGAIYKPVIVPTLSVLVCVFGVDANDDAADDNNNAEEEEEEDNDAATGSATGPVAVVVDDAFLSGDMY